VILTDEEMKLTPLRISIKNMRAHPVRAVILIALTFVQAFCIMFALLMSFEMRGELALAKARLGADILVYPTAAASKIDLDELIMQGTPVEVYKSRSLLDRMDSCDEISAVSHQIYISDTLANGDKITIVGYEPESDFVISPWLNDASAINTEAGSVIIGSDILSDEGFASALQKEGYITLFEEDWKISDVLLETGSLLDSAVFVSMDTLDKMIDAAEASGNDKYASVNPYTDFTVALLKIGNQSRVKSAADWINIYVRKVEAVRSEDSIANTSNGISSATSTIAFIAVIVWVVLLFAMGVTESMITKERAREIFVWRSIGASRAVIGRIMLTEAFIVHCIGAVAGVLPMLIVSIITRGSGIFKYLPGAGIVILSALATVCVTILVGLVFTLVSIKGAERKMNAQMLLI